LAKKKQKKAKPGKGEAAGAAKLPKRIAGVKVPKQLRESGGKLLEAVRHPLVMDIAAAALMAAAAALRDGKGKAAGAPAAAKPPEARTPDLAAILAATAVEGVRKIAQASRSSAKGNGARGKDGDA